MCTQSLLLTFWRKGFSSKMMECFSRKYKSAKTESDDDWCFNLWKEVERNFFKIKLFEWKVFKEKLFLDKRNVFSKKGGYVLEEYFKKTWLWNI